jgi:hypothetical protein
MIGWLAALSFILVFLLIAVIAIRRIARSGWDYLIVLAFTVLLIKPFYALTGDISAVLPNVWSEDADGKDQIILVSVAATFAWPAIAASLVLGAARAMFRKMRRV